MDAKEVRADKIDVRGYVGSDRTIQFIFLSFFFFFFLNDVHERACYTYNFGGIRLG